MKMLRESGKSYEANAAEVKNRRGAKHDITADPKITDNVAERPRVVDDSVNWEWHDKNGDEHVGTGERHDERIGDSMKWLGSEDGHDDEQVAD